MTVRYLYSHRTRIRRDRERAIDCAAPPQIGVPLFLYLYLDTCDACDACDSACLVSALGVLGVVWVLCSAIFRPCPPSRCGLRYGVAGLAGSQLGQSRLVPLRSRSGVRSGVSLIGVNASSVAVTAT